MVIDHKTVLDNIYVIYTETKLSLDIIIDYNNRLCIKMIAKFDF